MWQGRISERRTFPLSVYQSLWYISIPYLHIKLCNCHKVLIIHRNHQNEYLKTIARYCQNNSYHSLKSSKWKTFPTISHNCFSYICTYDRPQGGLVHQQVNPFKPVETKTARLFRQYLFNKSNFYENYWRWNVVQTSTHNSPPNILWIYDLFLSYFLKYQRSRRWLSRKTSNNEWVKTLGTECQGHPAVTAGLNCTYSSVYYLSPSRRPKSGPAFCTSTMQSIMYV